MNFVRMEIENKITEQEIWKALENVSDPEIPVISVIDLGIISGVNIGADGKVTIKMTPTFAGCPAIKYMQDDIKAKMQTLTGAENVAVLVDFENRWNSNKITEKGRAALKNFGLAPPVRYAKEFRVETLAQANCPYCGSANTTFKTPFGSTLCRSIHYCNDCKQSFEQFKPL